MFCLDESLLYIIKCTSRGMGMLVGVEISQDKESRKPNKDAAETLVYK